LESLWDVALLTEKRYLLQKSDNWYVQNILHEDRLIAAELRLLGLSCKRVAWDTNTDLSCFKYILFRTTWNYFEKLDKFILFLKTWNKKVGFINPYKHIMWNLDKKYLLDFQKAGINIPETIIVNQNQKSLLKDICQEQNWKDVIVKPCMSAGGWETYLVKNYDIHNFEPQFAKLIKTQNMMIQVFQKNILSFGEVSLMMIGQKFSHAVIKKVKRGDFRVQDDYGGTVESYSPSSRLILFANNIMQNLSFKPTYARIDVILDNNHQFALSELELIEPEMWFRFSPSSSKNLAFSIKNSFFNN
jgi:glutathione synthase/RimK-type ligase-like ATP-grasp enzyme